MAHNPFEPPQTEAKRKPSRTAWHMRATMVIFAIVLLLIVVGILVSYLLPIRGG